MAGHHIILQVRKQKYGNELAWGHFLRLSSGGPSINTILNSNLFWVPNANGVYIIQPNAKEHNFLAYLGSLKMGPSSRKIFKMWKTGNSSDAPGLGFEKPVPQAQWVSVRNRCSEAQKLSPGLHPTLLLCSLPST